MSMDLEQQVADLTDLVALLLRVSGDQLTQPLANDALPAAQRLAATIASPSIKAVLLNAIEGLERTAYPRG